MRSSNTDFVKKLTKAFLSSDVPLYKLSNNHVENLSHNISYGLPSEATSREIVLQLSADELQRT